MIHANSGRIVHPRHAEDHLPLGLDEALKYSAVEIFGVFLDDRRDGLKHLEHRLMKLGLTGIASENFPGQLVSGPAALGRRRPNLIRIDAIEPKGIFVTDWYYNIRTGEVEEGAQSLPTELDGPFASREEAARAPEIIAERSRKWAEEDAAND